VVLVATVAILTAKLVFANGKYHRQGSRPSTAVKDNIEDEWN
jgi:hypothetical protein